VQNFSDLFLQTRLGSQDVFGMAVIDSPLFHEIKADSLNKHNNGENSLTILAVVPKKETGQM
jgi:hypothetical protein